mmetsp:Transcript_37294/g.117346  ORF Transcript_37294/g.117346 Transcript_37294/m.117346 type:complete len:583 (-) Transcript_37294:67-1815(-)
MLARLNSLLLARPKMNCSVATTARAAPTPAAAAAAQRRACLAPASAFAPAMVGVFRRHGLRGALSGAPLSTRTGRLSPSSGPLGPLAASAAAAGNTPSGTSDFSDEYSPATARDMLEFINKSWTAFHATEEAKKMLDAAGYVQLSERDEWDIKPGGKYYVTRNMSSIIAFAVGGQYRPGNGFHIVAAHTDSPCLKLKPNSASTKSGYLGVGVQTYGGGLWHTWFDRDLSVAGRVLLRRQGAAGQEKLTHELVQINRPIMRVPTLAIHLDRTISTDGFKPNTETHVVPILATAIHEELSKPATAKDAPAAAAGESKPPAGPHHPLLLEILAKELGCSPEEIADFELNVCDTAPGVIGGGADEFVYSGRLDNLASSYCGLRALIDSTGESSSLEGEGAVRMCALFDNEEVGSDSAQGAGSRCLFATMKRAASLLGGGQEGEVDRALCNSFLVSADMAHALHPNYPERHEDKHQPKMHKGVVVKHNANQRYATTAVTSFLFREIARARGIPLQDFVVRNDMGCGSTIGPIVSAGIGIRTVDVGMPQLSMHSIREMCGTADVGLTCAHFRAFFEDFSALDARLDVD